MCIRITFPPTDRQIAEAQWALIDILEQTLTSSLRHRDARQSLHEALRHAREHSHSPRQWAAAFIPALLEIISSARSTAHTTSIATTNTRLQSDRVNSLEERVERLTKNRDRFLRESIERGTRVTELEDALRLAQDKHRRETDEHQRTVSDLQATIADLNRIVADQQERPDASGWPPAHK